MKREGGDGAHWAAIAGIGCVFLLGLVLQL